MKARIKVEVALEYEFNPSNYPEGSTAEQMLEIDLEAAKEDPFFLLDSGELTVTGELVHEITP